MDLFNDFYTTVLFLLEGLGVTVSVTVIALAVGFGLGVLMAVLRVYGSRPLSAFAPATVSSCAPCRSWSRSSSSTL
jgi:ABC-type amino acid transport system permease subunit